MEGITIRPFFFKNKPDKQGKCPVSICVTVNRKRTYKSTGFKILPKDWDGDNLCIRKSAANYSLINTSIRNRINDIQAELLKADLAGESISIQSFRKKKSKSVVEYIDQAVIDLFGKLSEGRIKHFQTERNRLHTFAPGIRFDEIDNLFLKRYEKFLRESGLKGNTIHSVWKRLIRIFNLARKDGITKNYPFYQYDNPKYKQTDRTWLSLSEIDSIENILNKPLPEYLIVTANYFLLGCYSGLRFSDWQRFNYDGFVHGERLILRAKKNGEMVSMKIHKRLKIAIDRVRNLPPIYTDQKTNEYLKAIAKIAGIKKHLTSHVGRHTFATQCAERNISIETCATFLGITVRECQVYYRITGTKLDKEIEKWNS